jgi:hypothetical protein
MQLRAIKRSQKVFYGSAHRHSVALLDEEGAASEIAPESLIDRRALEPEFVEVLWKRQLGDVLSWYLIELACFSLISAVSRSPMMRWGLCCRLTARAARSDISFASRASPRCTTAGL